MIRVVIVDDAPLLRERLRGWINGIPGVQVVGEAGDVASGLEEFRRSQPDVVILDIQMPDGSGIDLLDTIKAERALTRVVMLTNYPLPQLRKRCLDAGAECFLDKCGDVEEIREILQRITATIGGRTI